MKKMLTILFSLSLLLGSSGVWGQVKTTINFDIADNWTAGSGGITSYQSDHVYEESNMTFTGGPALRNGTAAQDGFAGALGTYSWRLRDATVTWTATYTEALAVNESFTGFGFDARRWDGSPSPSYLVEYSFNGGTDWNTASEIGSNGTLNNAAFGNSSDWSTFNQKVASNEGISANQFVVRLSATGGERIMVDNFYYEITARSTFTGSGNWSEVARWSHNVPTATMKAVINGSATVDGAATVNNITIGNGGSLLDNGNLTIDGVFTMQRTIANNNDWHMLSAPSNGMTIIGSDFVPAAAGEAPAVLPINFDFYSFDEVEATLVWVNIRQGDNTPNPAFGNFENGRGYLVAYDPSYGKTSFDFTGIMNSGNTNSPTLTYTALGQKGWNLIGNPYPSAIDWSAADRSKFADDFAYIYNESKAGGAGYEVVNGTIAPNQGFFVELNELDHNKTFEFTNAIRVHGGTFLKSETSQDAISLRFGNEVNYDETQIKLHEEASIERDRHDARKLFSFDANIPQLFTRSSDEVQLSINAIPCISEEVEIELGVRIPKTDNYYISLTELGTAFNQDVALYLKDTQNGTQQNMLENDTYYFAARPEDDPNRFLIQLGTLVSNHENSKETTKQIFVQGNTIYMLNAKGQTQLELYDLQGRLLQSDSFKANGMYTQVVDLPAGIYILRIMDDKGATTAKITIN